MFSLQGPFDNGVHHVDAHFVVPALRDDDVRIALCGLEELGVWKYPQFLSVCV